MWLDWLVMTLLFLPVIDVANAEDTTNLSDRIAAHSQARDLAIELVSSVFDVQLRHLAENGLSEQPLYNEIRSSRDRIDQLASDEMMQLTLFLENLQTSQGEDRNKLLAEARVTARRIAVAMMAERQRLRGRLRSSRTLDLLRQMIALEQQAIVVTEGIPSRPASEQLQSAEELIQSHLDLAVLFDQLTSMLRQTEETVGPERISAVAALSNLTTAQTSVRIVEATDFVKAGSYAEALMAEQNILGALIESLRLLQQSDKLEEEARRKAIEAIEKTVKEQQELRRQTAATDLSDAKDRDALSARQRAIAEQLEQLREQLSQLAQVGEQMLAATDAAQQAVKHLGEGQKEQAVERQDTVINMLDDIAQHLNAEKFDPDALADRAAQLQELNTSLNELLEKQAEARELAGADPASAAELEAAIADALAEADDTSQLNSGVETRLDEAQEAVAKAEQALEDGSPAAEQNRLEAVENAEKSLMEAAAEVQAQLSDVQQAMEAANPSESNPSSDSTSKNEASSGTTRDAGSTSISEPGADVESRSFEKEAWFTRLPADLQNRIRGATRRPAPRGYETRLQRYFQTDD
jgi:predicted  nucleic acid-binding Zn-ribbon protein